MSALILSPTPAGAGAGADKRAQSRRPATPRRLAFLLSFHAVLAGAFAVAWFSGDEDTYRIHLIAGYAALLALTARFAGACDFELGPEAGPREKRDVINYSLAVSLSAGVLQPAQAQTPQQKLLAEYAVAAKAADPAFAGFSAERGQALYLGPHKGGKPETPACAACHTQDPRNAGRHVSTGRDILPMALSANPKRFTDRADVEKRFARDCPGVLGRDCGPAEKGDFITYLISR